MRRRRSGGVGTELGGVCVWCVQSSVCDLIPGTWVPRWSYLLVLVPLPARHKPGASDDGWAWMESYNLQRMAGSQVALRQHARHRLRIIQNALSYSTQHPRATSRVRRSHAFNTPHVSPAQRCVTARTASSPPCARSSSTSAAIMSPGSTSNGRRSKTTACSHGDGRKRT